MRPASGTRAGRLTPSEARRSRPGRRTRGALMAMVGVLMGGLAATLPTAKPASAAAYTGRLPGPTVNEVIEDVTCAAPADCWAVGRFDLFYDRNPRALIDHWDGAAWHPVDAANSDTDPNDLVRVACANSTECWAVGHRLVGGNPEALIESWDGTSWTVSDAVVPNGVSSELMAVACDGTSRCWAVGVVGTSNNARTLIEQWDGTTWSVMGSPDVGTSSLSGIECISSADCWSVGSRMNGNTPQMLAERWDGASWSVMSPIGSLPALTSVTCAVSTSCWAAGAGTVLEHWDGASWTTIAGAAPRGGGPWLLNAAFCLPSSDCWAVGGRDQNYADGRPLTERWNGHAWAIISSPSPTSGVGMQSLLQSITCASISECWSVGEYGSASNSYTVSYGLTEGWDGAQWTIVDGGGLAMTIYDDKSPSVAYFKWTAVTDSGAYGGSYLSSSTKNDASRFTFTGNDVTWHTYKGPDQGIAALTVDGQRQGLIDLYAPARQAFSVSVTGLPAGSHTAIVRVTGTQNSAATGANVAVDSWTVAANTYDATDVGYRWRSQQRDGFYGNEIRVSDTKGAFATLTFAGTRVDFLGGGGVVTIDGTTMPSGGGYLLSPGTHTIVVTAVGPETTLDAFVVFG